MHDLSGAELLDDASGDVVVGVQFKRQRAVTRKRGGERVEDRGVGEGARITPSLIVTVQ